MKKFYKRIVSSLFLIFLIAHTYISFAQPSGVTVTYASFHSSGGSGSRSISNPEYVAGTSGSSEPNENSASLSANGQVASTSSAWVQMEFPEISSSPSAPGTVFIRTNTPSSFLLSGGLTITAANGGTNVSIPGGYKTYYTTDGKVYIAVTPNANFKTVRLTITSGLLNTVDIRVYHAYYSSTSSNGYNPYPMAKTDCGRPNATSKEFSGALLTAFDVASPLSAIDDDLTSKSSFVSTGLALISGFIRQTFIFNGDSNPADAVRITLSQTGSFAKVMLGRSLTVKAYKGLNLVGNAALLNTVLDADLLNLFAGNGTQITFFFAPKETDGTSVIFDRLELELDISLLGLGLGADGINVHDVRRVPDIVNASDAIACTNLGVVNLVANAKQALIPDIGTFNYEWWSALRDGDKLASTQTYNTQGLTTTGTATYYVQTQKSGSGCSYSARKKVTVTIINPPVNPPIVFSP